MTYISAILDNTALIAAVTAWFIAQTLKVILSLIITRRFDFTRFVGTGGMPSSHSALVMSVSTAVGLQYGFGSGLFAVSICIASIVMTDAAGVRRSAGETAALVNRVVEHLIQDGLKGITEDELKELIGHTPIEVIVGGALGIAVAIIMA